MCEWPLTELLRIGAIGWVSSQKCKRVKLQSNLVYCSFSNFSFSTVIIIISNVKVVVCILQFGMTNYCVRPVPLAALFCEWHRHSRELVGVQDASLLPLNLSASPLLLLVLHRHVRPLQNHKFLPEGAHPSPSPTPYRQFYLLFRYLDQFPL